MNNTLPAPSRSSSVAEMVLSHFSDDGSIADDERNVKDLEALRFGVDILVHSQAKIPSRVHEVVDACWRGSGYAPTATSAHMELASTYYALRVLQVLDRGLAYEPQARKLKQWVIDSIYDPEMGVITVDMDLLYYGTQALCILGDPIPDAVAAAITVFVSRCESHAGGFAAKPGQGCDVERTYVGVNLARLLSIATATDAHRLWIARCQRGPAIADAPDVETSRFPNFYWGARAATLTGAKWDWQTVVRGVESARGDRGAWERDGKFSLWYSFCGLRASQIAHSELLK